MPFALSRGHHSRCVTSLGALGMLLCVSLAANLHAQRFAAVTVAGTASDLPNAPSVVLLNMAGNSVDDLSAVDGGTLLPPCPPAMPPAPPSTMPSPQNTTPAVPCRPENPLRIVINADQRSPLTVRQKGMLAVRDVTDPVNLAVIAAEAGFGVAFNAHSAYGPGLEGFGRLFGYEMLQDAQGEFFGTFLIPSLVHEDPRYRRLQHASVKRRIGHALLRTVIAEHDNGRRMINYATLLTYPISAELSNLYVPGVQDDGPQTLKRIGIGLATDPAGNLIAEFLPDLALRIHIRSVFIQQIVNHMAVGENGTQ